MLGEALKELCFGDERELEVLVTYLDTSAHDIPNRDTPRIALLLRYINANVLVYTIAKLYKIRHAALSYENATLPVL